MNKIKKKDLAYLYGQMEENILVIGKMGSKMDMGNIFHLMEKLKLVNGLQGKGLIGFLKKRLIKEKLIFHKKTNISLTEFKSFFVLFL